MIDKTKFNLGYFVKGEGWKDFFKAWGLGWRLILTFLILFFLASGIKGCFLKEPKNINKPKVTVLPGAKVEKIDQTSTQINFEREKTWEAGIGVGMLNFDNKTGNGGFVWLKKRW